MREYIIVHHSGAEEKDTAQIKRYHTQSLGWRDIGYHFVIERDGKVVTGRSISLPGAHCKDKGMNTKGIGVCMIGNMNNHAPTPAQYSALVNHVASLCKQHNIPVGNILGHREVSATACPGKHTNMEQVRKDVEQKIGVSASISSFRDVPGDHWALDDIQYLASLGIIRGDENGFLRPGDTATRAEVFVITARVLEYLNRRIREVME